MRILKNSILLIAVVLLACAQSCNRPVDNSKYFNLGQVVTADNELTAAEKAQGWQLLFDGETLEGWHIAGKSGVPDSGWVVTEGQIVKYAQQPGSRHAGDIVTDALFKNFIVKVDFKISEAGNSGLKYFVDPAMESIPGGASIGCEFQMLDDERHPDAKAGVKGNRTLSSLYDLIPAQKEDAPFDLYDFNTAMVYVCGNHVEHWLNGVKVVEYERGTQMWNALVAYSKYRHYPNFGNAEYGHLLLQDHNDEIRFKNIKIKVLD